MTGNPQTDLIFDKRGRRTTEIIKARTTQALRIKPEDGVEDLSIDEAQQDTVKGGRTVDAINIKQSVVSDVVGQSE